ncbi:LuxR C-terminal-related transcriptional regulator [uncultured Parasutterella sp.]|nr:LuxR C-terminal-related transcriptional regulator [uncultured Parasutterella sp.]
MTEKTVQIHRGSLCRKMSIRSQVEIANLVKIVLEER